MSAQAVGGAVGHNEISVIIPCHRVVGTNGSLTGYAGGIDKKIALLELEHVDINAGTGKKLAEESQMKNNDWTGCTSIYNGGSCYECGLLYLHEQKKQCWNSR